MGGLYTWRPPTSVPYHDVKEILVATPTEVLSFTVPAGHTWELTKVTAWGQGGGDVFLEIDGTEVDFGTINPDLGIQNYDRDYPHIPIEECSTIKIIIDPCEVPCQFTATIFVSVTCSRGCTSGC